MIATPRAAPAYLSRYRTQSLDPRYFFVLCPAADGTRGPRLQDGDVASDPPNDRGDGLGLDARVILSA